MKTNHLQTFDKDKWANKRIKYVSGLQLRTARNIAKLTLELQRRLDDPTEVAKMASKDLGYILKGQIDALGQLSQIELHYSGHKGQQGKDGAVTANLHAAYQIIVQHSDKSLNIVLEDALRRIDPAKYIETTASTTASIPSDTKDSAF